MKLEDQVVSLELAKKLKELGVKQESYFWWVNPDLTEKNVTQLLSYDERFINHHPDLYFSAFTAAELGPMIPFTIKVKDWKGFDGEYTWYCTQHVGYTAHDYNPPICYHFNMHEHIEFDKPGIDPLEIIGVDFVGNNEADTRALMLIWLIENGYVNVKEKTNI